VQNPIVETLQLPRLRGVFHQWAFVAAVAAGCVLVALSEGSRERVAALVYATSLVAMFGASALYHRFPWPSASARALARRVDHAMIYVFIAATYTPFALLRFDGSTQVVVLAAVWGGATLGVVLKLAWLDAPRQLSAICCLAVGWVGAIALPQLFSAVGAGAGVLVVVGAGVYTIGAIAYAAAWPNPLPATFGFHEVFHLLVVVAATTQFVAVSLVVL
jgi:hemolysin III